MNANTLTQDQLKTLLHYDPDTGVFTWLPRDAALSKRPIHTKAWNAKWAGKVAGGVSTDGYIRVRLLGKRYKAHRLAFMYMQGAFPPEDTDHINHITGDNRWINLRAVTHAVNGRNAKISSNNKSGVMGVYWSNHHKRWRAQIMYKGRIIHLGSFSSVEEAAAARAKASVQCGFHQNHGT